MVRKFIVSQAKLFLLLRQAGGSSFFFFINSVAGEIHRLECKNVVAAAVVACSMNNGEERYS